MSRGYNVVNVMREHENNLRIFWILTLSVLMHVAFFAALPWLSAYFERPQLTTTGSWFHDRQQPASPLERQRSMLQLGQDKATAVTTVAWIPHEDARELLARLDHTQQPAAQMQADPQPDAPFIIDATQAADASPNAPPPAELAELPTPPIMPPVALPSPSPIPVPASEDSHEPALVESPSPSLAQEVASVLEAALPREPAPSQPVARTAPPAPATQPTTSPSSEEQARPRPTAAARTEREAPPTSIEQSLHGSPSGRVQVMEGLEVLTVSPRVSVISFLTASPRDAVVEMTFDSQGRVTTARIVESSRYADIDAAIEAAVFRWRARGHKLEEAPHTIRVTFRM